MFGLFDKEDPKEQALREIAESKGYKTWDELITNIGVSIKKKKKPPKGMTIEEARSIMELDLSVHGNRMIVAKS